jgi:spermidine/putrescine transport system ATP-binding protein
MHGKDVILEDVSVTYSNGFTAVHPTRLTVRAGEFFSILGPSGCGKTTILRTVSGFMEPSSGRVLIGGEDQRGIGPNGRPTALIFQNLALFPLMSVWENVAFGLEARGMSRRKRRDRADELLDLVALGGQADKKPGELSGGQRQRVAIARALAVEPSVLLLDEPLSALDLKLRQHMRAELRAIQKKTGVTFIYITHDQGEALTMSDSIAVMNEGRVEQVGPADEIYSAPHSAFVASFVGEANQFPGIVSGTRGGGIAVLETPFGQMLGANPKGLVAGDRAILFVRPELVRFGSEHDTQFTGRIARRDLEGPFVTYRFVTDAGAEVIMHAANTGAPMQPGGDALSFGFSHEHALALPEGKLAKTGMEIAS